MKKGSVGVARIGMLLTAVIMTCVALMWGCDKANAVKFQSESSKFPDAALTINSPVMVSTAKLYPSQRDGGNGLLNDGDLVYNLRWQFIGQTDVACQGEKDVYVFAIEIGAKYSGTGNVEKLLKAVIFDGQKIEIFKNADIKMTIENLPGKK